MATSLRDDNRPDPDALLAKLEADQQRAKLGKLKIFFGASPGVGKTYAMLAAARQQRDQGIDVAIGVIETHGRSETAAMLQSLEVLPLKEIFYKGHVLKEFDLDGALARKPKLLLVDELAHSNLEGSRHPKRWLDVEELLDAGIDVYTTVNVQHLESLNDVVGGITGIKVWETLPDRVFDEADEVMLVDLPPDELLQRLKKGKVYLPQQAEQAVNNFFRKGNLLALRELALRRTADRVDDDVVAYRRDKSVASIWPTQGALLVGLGPNSGGEKLIRNAARLASQLSVSWHAVYIETPKLQRLSESERDRILKTLRLAANLGAHTSSLSGEDAAQSLVAYAREHNLSKVIVGRHFNRWRYLRLLVKSSLISKLGVMAPDIDLILVDCESSEDQLQHVPRRFIRVDQKFIWREFALATVAVFMTSLIATPLRDRLDLANIVMIFLLGVVFCAFKLGRGPAVLSAFLSVASFDFFFVPPRFSFAVTDVQYLITFAVMLVAALVIGQLTAGLRFQARVAESRERRMRALYEMARELSSVLVISQIEEIGDRFVSSTFGAHARLWLPDENDKLSLSESDNPADGLDLGVAQWAFDHGEAAGQGTGTLPANPYLYVPLKGTMRVRGVMAMSSRQEHWMLSPEQQRLLDTFAALIGIAVERVHYITIAQEAVVNMESERLRNSLLSSLSHDLRTPLTALVGLIDTMVLAEPHLSPIHAEFAAAIKDQAMRTNAQVSNLLDMAKLQAGKVKLNKAWQPLEDVVGSALKERASVLTQHRIQTSLPFDLPLLAIDAVLIERVLCNLIENAAKYSPPDSSISIAAHLDDVHIVVEVSDEGYGLPPGKEAAIFEKFTRGQEESAISGVGLGLAIARSIVEAHGGIIYAKNRISRGAVFSFTLPIGKPPTIRTHL